MAQSAPENRQPVVVTTSSEILPDGSLIEMISSNDGEDLQLLHYDGNGTFTAPKIECGGRLYQPPDLHPTLRRAIRLPKGIADYGSAVALFQKVAALVERYIGLSGVDRHQATAWSFTTCVADCLPNPPPLIVSGLDPWLANRLFGLFCCFCRRGLRLGEITRSAFGLLPMELRPALMIMQQDLPTRIWSLCNASNYRGAVIPGRGGAVLDVVCSKAIFVGMDEIDSNYPAIHLSLPLESSDLPALDDREQNRIADDLLPQMLKYRLDRLREFHQIRCADGQKKPKTELARNLMLCLTDDPELQPALTSILEAEEAELPDCESREVKSAIIEVLWTKISGPTSEIGVAQLADLTNALLRSGGSTLIYKPEEVGWKLREMGIRRLKKAACNVVRFTRENRRRVHEIARNLGLDLPPHPNTCIDCIPPQSPDQ